MATIDALIQSAAEQHLPGWDWRYLKVQYWQESRFDPEAVSPAGAVGIAQFMPGTWRDYSGKAGYKTAKRTSVEASIVTGAYYMRHLLDQWTSPRPPMDRYCLALASYNAGLGNLVKAQKAVNGKLFYHEIIAGLPLVTGARSKETIGYVKKILGYYNNLVTLGKL